MQVIVPMWRIYYRKDNQVKGKELIVVSRNKVVDNACSRKKVTCSQLWNIYYRLVNQVKRSVEKKNSQSM